LSVSFQKRSISKLYIFCANAFALRLLEHKFYFLEAKCLVEKN